MNTDKQVKTMSVALMILLLIMAGCSVQKKEAYLFETGGVIARTDSAAKAESGMYRSTLTDAVYPNRSDTTAPECIPETERYTEPETLSETEPETIPPETRPPVTASPETEPPVTDAPATTPPETKPPVTEPPVTEPPVTEPPVTEPPETEPPVTEPPETEPPVTSYDYSKPVPLSEAVDSDFFRDAAFIGDSLTVALMNHTGWQTTKLSKVGASLFGIVKQLEMIDISEVVSDEPHGRYGISDQIIDGLTGKVTYYSLLKRLGNPSKIYICLGANDTQILYVSTFENSYRQLIADLKQMYPQAKLYIGSVLPISKELSEGQFAATGGNDRIREMNAVVRKLCEQEKLYYLDTYSIMVDGEGNLKEAYSSDGIHLTSAGYGAWKQYLLTHYVRE